MGASQWCECPPLFALCTPSIYSRYLHRLSTVFPSVVFHSASRAFVVGFSFIDNLLMVALVGFCPLCVSKLPLPCHPPFLFHLSLLCLPLRIGRLFLSRVLLFYTLCGDRWLRILNLQFFTPCRTGVPGSSKTFSFSKVFFRSGDGPAFV